MGIFNFLKKREQPEECTLSQAMAMIKENEDLDLIPLDNGKFMVVSASERQAQIDEAKQEVRKNNILKGRKEEFMEEVTGNGKYKRIPSDISVSHSDRPGKVIRDYYR